MRLTVNNFEFSIGDSVIRKTYKHDGSPWEEYKGKIGFGEYWIYSSASHDSWCVIGWYMVEENGEEYPVSYYDKLYPCDNPQ